MRSQHSQTITIIGILFLVVFLLIMPVTAMDLPFIRPFPAAGSNSQLQLNEITAEIVADTGPWQTWSKDSELLENLSGSLAGMSSVTAPTLIKQKCFGGSQDENSYQSIRQTSDGGFVLITSYSLSNDGDVSGNHGKKDIWIAKLRNDWSVEWQKSLGGSGDDVASSFEFSSNNETFLIFGTTTSNDGDVSGNHGGTDIWVVNMSLNGTILWQRCFGGTGDETDLSMTNLYSADPGRLLTVTSTSNDGDIIGNHGGKDVCVIKLFPNFTTSWQKCYGGTGVEVKTSFQPELINNTYSYTFTAFSNSNNGDVSGNHGGFDAWMVKINATGSIVKQNCFGGSNNDNTTSTSVWFSKDQTAGKYYYLGTTWSNDGDASGNHGGTDIWYLKINADTLVPDVHRCFGGSGNDTHSVLLSNQDGSFTVLGTVKSNDGDIQGFHGGMDIWIADIQKDLSVSRQTCLGGSGDDKIQGLSTSSDRSVFYLTTSTNSNDGDITGNHGGYDTCYLRVTDGSVDWQKCFGGSLDETGGSIALQNDGSALMTLMTNSNDGDVSGNHGKNDIWLAQLSSGIRADFSVDQSSGLIPLKIRFSDRSQGAVVNRSWDFGDGTTSTEKYPSHTYIIPDNYTASLTVFGNYSYDVKSTVINAKQVPPSPPIIWQKTFGNFSDATGIQETTDGGYVVAGYTLANFVNFSFWNYDYWILKLNENGVLEWEKSFGGSAEDVALGIRQTTDGGYIIAGGSRSTDGDVSGNHGGYDYWIVKLDTSRNIQWKKSLGGSGDDIAYSVRQTTDGGYIVAGMSNSTNGDVSGNHGNPDYWLVKLDTNGNLQWQKSYGGSAEDDASSVRQTSDGGYIIAGQSKSSDGDISGNHGYFDYWIVKTDTNGNLQWQKSFGGSGDDSAYSIEQTKDSGYIIAGSTESYNGDITGFHGGYEDYWLVKTDNNGLLQWEKCFGGSDSDIAASIQPTLDSGYIVAGSSQSDDGDVRGHHGDSGYSGKYDYWVAKLVGEGEIEWQKSLGGNSTDVARTIQQTRDGGYIVGGYSQSNDGDVSGNSGTAFWIVKLANSVSDYPVADFTMNTTLGIAPISVQFADLSHGNIASRYWQFGDGNTSTEKNPVYVYRYAGLYTVNLTVSNGTISSSQSKSISVYNSLVANFTANTTTGLSPLRVQFYDQSTGDIVSRKWDFGDGVISFEQNPVHTYNFGGNYSVTLNVYNPAKNDRITKRNFISVQGVRRVLDINPRVVQNLTGTTIQIYGEEFTNGMDVQIQKENLTPIHADAIILSSPTLLITKFNLNGLPPDLYNVVIQWPDGERRNLSSSIEIAPKPEGSLWFVGLSMSPNSPQTYEFNVPASNNLFITFQRMSGYNNWYYSKLTLSHNGSAIANKTSSHDLMLHIVNPQPGNYSITVDPGYFSGKGILNVWTSLPELPLNEWIVGTVHTSYGSIWYQVDVPANQTTLEFDAEGIGLASHFDIYKDVYEGPQHWMSDYSEKPSIMIPNPEPGLYIAEYLDSAILAGDDQTRDILIKADTSQSIDPLPGFMPIITSISTNKGGNTGLVTIDIKGAWLDPNAVVSLVRPGFSDINAQYISGMSDGASLSATFNLTGKESGGWNLTIINPNGQNVVAHDPFTIENGGKAEVWAEIVGREQIRIGRPQKYIIRYGNRGLVNADSGEILVWFPKDVSAKLLSKPLTTDCPAVEYNPDKLPTDYSYNTSGYMVIFFDIAPQSVDELYLTLTAPPNSEPFNVYVRTSDDFRSSANRTVNFASSGLTSLDGQNKTLAGLSYVLNGEQTYEIKTEYVVGYTGIYGFNNVKIDHPIITLPQFDQQGNVIGQKSWTDISYVDITGKVKDKLISGNPTSVKNSLLYNEPHLKISEYSGSRSLTKDQITQLEFWLNYFTDDRNGFKHVEQPFKEIITNPDGSETFTGDCIGILDYCAEKAWKNEPGLSGGFVNDATNRYEGKSIRDWFNVDWKARLDFPQGIIQGPMEEWKKHVSNAADYIRIRPVQTIDPEDKFGPTGYDEPNTSINERFIPADESLYYRIDFWNKENATAPVCDVYFYDDLTPNVNRSTFRFREIGFMNWTVSLEPSQYFNINVDTRPEMNLFVNVEGTYNQETGRVNITYRSLDPATFETPDDPMAGFLPPITQSGIEIGWVSFTVDPDPGLATGTIIQNQAHVNFDGVGPFNPAPKEGPYTNTIDSGKPTSWLSAVVTNGTEIQLTLSGVDDAGGSGVRDYTIYLSDNGGGYTPILNNIITPNASIEGMVGHTYRIYSSARDHVGNRENSKPLPDATVTIPYTNGTASKIGVIRNSHDWYLDSNGNGIWDGASIDIKYALGKVGDLPVVGDWNGNGITEIGVFRDNHTWNVDYNGNGVWDGIAGGDRIYITGKPGDVPVPGDWNGDNITEMAVFRGNHTWYIDYNGNGLWDSPAGGDRIYITGKPGDIPVPCDWNGDGITEMSVFRGNHTWYIDYNGNGIWDSPAGGDRIYTTGQPGDLPVFGDWNGDRLCEMGVFRSSNHNFYLDFNANGTWDGASVDKRYDFGTFGDIPVSGKW